MSDLISDSTNDLINRQAAIDAIRRDADLCELEGDGWQTERRDRDTWILEGLPSAQPKREKGVWKEREILSKEDGKDIDQWQCARCSECGRYHTTPFLYSFNDYNFCPHCGAKMSGGTKLKK